MSASLHDRHIGVLLGGRSAEREISLKSGAAVLSALRSLGHRVTPIDAPPEALDRAVAESAIDVAFIALHGENGEDGTVQGLLALAGIPYTGPGVLGSALAMHKPTAKRLLQAAGIPTPPGVAVTHATRNSVELPPYPLFIKPASRGSSVAAGPANNPGELEQRLDAALAIDTDALVETQVMGIELAVGILDGEVLGGCEIRPETPFYDYAAKYVTGHTQYLCPPTFPEAVLRSAYALARRTTEVLCCTRGAVRADLIITPAGEPYVFELNTIPGLTEVSLLPRIAQSAGIAFPALVERMLLSALAPAR